MALQKDMVFLNWQQSVHEQDKSYRGTKELYLIRIQILSMCHCLSNGRRKNGNLKKGTALTEVDREMLRCRR